MERLQGQLQTSESSNTQLKEKVETMEEELREANLEREGLRSLNERSSAELRRALEVRITCVCVCVCVCARTCMYMYVCMREREREMQL